MATRYSISDVPGLQDAFLDAMTSDPIHARQFVAQVTKDPISFVKNRLPYEITSDVKNNRNYENTKKSIEFLKNAGLSETELQSVYESSVSEAKNLLAAQSGGGGFFGSDFLGAALPIAAAFAVPVIGAEIGSQLVASNLVSATYAPAVGTALASVAVQTAQGADLDTAVKNATVNAIVQTGSTDIAKDINAAIKDPAVTNAITSVGASVVKTAALGGNADDIVKNATAALAGSGVSTATDDKVLGSAAAGAITGGTTGAALGAAGALGSEASKPTTTNVSAAEQQIIDAFAKSQTSQDLANMIASANLTPEERAFLQEAQQSTFAAASTAQALPAPTTDVGTAGRSFSPFAANDPRFISAMQKNPDLLQKFSEYTNSYGFNTPELNVVYKGLLEEALKQDPTYQPLLEEYKKITGQDYQLPSAGEIEITAPKYEPEVITPPSTTPEVAPSGKPVIPPVPATEAAPAPAVTPSPAPATEPSPVPEPVPKQALEPAKTTPPAIGREAGAIIGIGGSISDQPSTTTTKSTSDVAPVTQGTTTDKPIAAIPDEEKAVGKDKESTYTPELFIYGGQYPSALSRALGTTLQAPGGTPTATTGLTSYRAEGEIEGESGINRENVWNEASLRLKDALGL